MESVLATSASIEQQSAVTRDVSANMQGTAVQVAAISAISGAVTKVSHAAAATRDAPGCWPPDASPWRAPTASSLRRRARVERYRDTGQRRVLAADPDVRRFSHWADVDEAAFAVSIAAMGRRSPPDSQGWINLAIVLTGGYADDHALLVEGTAAKLGITLLPAMRGTGLGREVIAGSLA